MMKNRIFALSALILLSFGCATQPKEISNEEVRLTVRKHIEEVLLCYQATLERNPKIEGKLVAQWQITPEGRASHFSSLKESSTITDGRLIQCVGDALVTWQFPAPSSSAVIEVTYPFYFSPQHSDLNP